LTMSPGSSPASRDERHAPPSWAAQEPTANLVVALEELQVGWPVYVARCPVRYDNCHFWAAIRPC
jgi:hypothetical protein